MADAQSISVTDILTMLYRRRLIIMTIAGLFVALGLIFAIIAKPLYTASVIVKPVTEDGPGALSGLGRQFSGAAALAGINLSAGPTDKNEYLAILRSRELAEAFIAEYDLKRHLFPGQWNEQTQKWQRPELSWLSRLKLSISELLADLSQDEGWETPIRAEPSDWQAYRAFNERLRTIEEDAETGIVTVSFTFPRPELAARWANAYIAMANEIIREDTVAEASRALGYLQEEVEQTSVAGLRQTIFNLVETQLERITLANARAEYAFKVLDPAVVPEDRTSPRRSLMVILALIFGTLIGCFAAFCWELFVTFRNKEVPNHAR